MTIVELAPRISRGELRARDLIESCLEAIERRNGELRAFTTVMAEQARDAAQRLDQEIRAGHWRGPLHGIPISLKDLIDVRGLPTSAASHVRDGHVAAADAPIVERLRRAGAVLIGKTNLHEFAYGTTSEDSAFGAVRNPYDSSRSAGGSSGGSAVAIAAGMCLASVGTDTGGSIRIPSAACGTVGLKPSFGEIPIQGVTPLSQSLDHVGPLAQSVADAWVLYDVLRGASPVDWTNRKPRPLRDRRLAVLRPYFLDLLDDEVRTGFEMALDRLRAEGAVLVDRAILHADLIAHVYLLVQLPESSVYHSATLTQRPGDYCPAVRLRLELGRQVLAEDYLRAQRGREVLRTEVDQALDGVEGLLLPTLPIPAPPVGTSTVVIGGSSVPLRSLMLRLTQLFNLTGHPAISLPDGRTRAGLPCGLQIAGRQGSAFSLWNLAFDCEAALQIPPAIPAGEV